MTLGDIAQLVIAASVAFNCYQSWRNGRKAERLAEGLEVIKKDVQTIEIATNSMKDALVTATGKASYAEGLAEGKSTPKET
jgi:hypothetical protein